MHLVYLPAVSSNLHLHLSSSCHVTHKASTLSHQPALSAAAICTSLQFFHPAFSLSLSAVLLHVVSGLPRFLRPSGVQVNAVLQSLFDSFLMMWPMNFHLLLRTSPLRFSISAICRTSLFVILSYQRILNIRLRHLLWKTSISAWSMIKGLHHPQKSRSSSFVVNFHFIPVFSSCNAFLITQSTTRRNSKPGMLQSCFTPVLILNHSVHLLHYIHSHHRVLSPY